MITAWDQYLNPPEDKAKLSAYRKRGAIAFRHQREVIAEIFRARDPKAVACLGAGLLNDIPYREFVDAGATIHLVDWVADLTEFGISRSIMKQETSNNPDCVYCHLNCLDPSEYCTGYKEPGSRDDGVCDSYEPLSDHEVACKSFKKGALPNIHLHDVTGGYGNSFGTALGDYIAGAETWRQALKRAINLAKKVEGRHQEMAIKEGSIDLVLSSLVVSQFEHEPYNYFSRQVAHLLGQPGKAEEARLRPMMEQLRSLLLKNQVDGHCREIKRILSDTGRCFMSFEMMHSPSNSSSWFLVRQMHEVLELVAHHFEFDIDGLSGPVSGPPFENQNGRSVAYHLLLAHKGN